VAQGVGARASGGIASVALGHFSRAEKDASFAAGSRAVARSRAAIALGDETCAGVSCNATKSGFFDANGNATTSDEDMLDDQDISKAPPPIAIGGRAFATAPGSVAIGARVRAVANHALALGARSVASGNFSVALGGGFGEDGGAKATELSAIAIGTGASCTSPYTLAIGTFANSSGFNSSSIGTRSNASGNNSIAIGINATVRSLGGVAVGQNAFVAENATHAFAFPGAAAFEPESVVALGRVFADDFVVTLDGVLDDDMDTVVDGKLTPLEITFKELALKVALLTQRITALEATQFVPEPEPAPEPAPV
tara:strand:+ start:258 stop:1190 length:933 start_codon:yes stop_codon:yes gene_type:complete